MLSLLKAVLSQDMNLFNYSAKKNSKKSTKILLPIFLFLIVGFSVGTYAYNFALLLKPLNLTYIMISIFLAIVSLLTFIEGIYKSQSILFEVKDNNLLFSLPIKSSMIIFIRIIKLLIFEYLYNLMFLLPAFIVYIIFEHPSINFYIISFLMTFIIIIIPTILSCFIGYLIKLISSKVKYKKIIQTILTVLILIGIILLSFKSENLINVVINNATFINDILSKLYYPIGAYNILINKFDILVFIKLLLINIIPFILFILITKNFYLKIISNLNNRNSSKNKKLKYNNIKINKPIISLTKKELKRYFSSTVYMINTSFGLFLIIIVTFMLSIKGKESLVSMINEIEIININIDMIYYELIFFSLIFTSITSSSISLEGKTINITKSLPIKWKTIFNAKILSCFVIELPFIILSIVIYTVFYKPSIIFIIEILLISIVSILLSAIIGLIINLKYPKLDASSDTEIVKQSMSSMVSVFIGFGIFIISNIFIGLLIDKINLYLVILIHLIILSISNYILYNILNKKGYKYYLDLNV